MFSVAFTLPNAVAVNPGMSNLASFYGIREEYQARAITIIT